MQNDQLKDKDIVSRVIKGDIEAYGHLMTRYEQKLLRYVAYLARDQVSAEDIIQDTFIKVYRNLRGFNPKHKFSSWIYRIAHNETMNAIKKEKHLNHEIDIEKIEDSVHTSNIVNEIDKKILGDQLKACLNDMENKYREILMLQYYEDMKYSEQNNTPSV